MHHFSLLESKISGFVVFADQMRIFLVLDMRGRKKKGKYLEKYCDKV